MLWIRVGFWFELKARKEVQRRVVSVQFSGVGYEEQSEWNWGRTIKNRKTQKGFAEKFILEGSNLYFHPKKYQIFTEI